jgi:glycine cleavage system H protein
VAASESYPEQLRYHEEHDWARVEDGEATLGITWFAQDALGELVHFEAPEEGATVNEDPYGEGWLIRIRVDDPAEVDSLLDADAYRAVLAEQ